MMASVLFSIASLTMCKCAKAKAQSEDGRRERMEQGRSKNDAVMRADGEHTERNRN